MEDSDSILAQFNRLMRDLENGTAGRNCFRPWEIELLIDIESCNLDSLSRRRVLERYRNAVRRELGNGSVRPLKLSEYLARLAARHAGQPASAELLS